VAEFDHILHVDGRVADANAMRKLLWLLVNDYSVARILSFLSWLAVSLRYIITGCDHVKMKLYHFFARDSI